jgi:hypothetical protein
MPSHTAYELVLAAFCANLPFGAYRSTVRRLNWRWLLAIHLPIPVIFLLRTAAGYSYWFIPWLFIAAVSGQLLGGQLLKAWRRRHACQEAAPGDLDSVPTEETPATAALPAEQGQVAIKAAARVAAEHDQGPLRGLR